MTEITTNTDNYEEQTVSSFARKAYLNYAMYVILDRALPHIGDGLKPVQRRIIYAMSEIGLSSLSKHKKSARTVGDVLGKYHPHGDAACYEAMVIMAQNFSYRYPIIDGQGNWGTPDDPKSFAAMRYTESRLSKYANILLDEVKSGTVDWALNFDGTLNEPKLLPAQIPNVLLNGAMGIAVGMSTDIPPHNIYEVINACLALLKNNNLTYDDLIKIIPAPDYPGGADIITPLQERQQMYENGIGAIKLRAVFHKNEENNIIITRLPHQVSSGKIIEQIAIQIRNKKIPWLQDIRDESDYSEPVRIVLTPSSKRVDSELLMSHLFATTDLEKKYRVNMNMIGINGKPAIKPLLSLLKEWLEYRRATIIRRIQFNLNKILERLHALEGYLIAHLNIDEIISIIRNEDRPKQVLIERFNLSEMQAEAILNLKLRNLAKLEEIQITKEKTNLEKEKNILEGLLSSDVKLKNLMQRELNEALLQNTDERRSSVVLRDDSKAIDEAAWTPVENITVILSSEGWLRCAKGHEIEPEKLQYKTGDMFFCASKGRSNQYCLLIDTNGKIYSLLANVLPSARGQGEPITSRINLEADCKISSMHLACKENFIVIARSDGYGFFSKCSNLCPTTKNGKQLISTGKDNLICSWVGNNKDESIIIISNLGMVLVFSKDELSELNKGKGNKIIQFAKNKTEPDKIKFIASFSNNAIILLHSGKRHIKLEPKNLDQYRSNRGKKGALLPRGFQSVSSIEINHK